MNFLLYSSISALLRQNALDDANYARLSIEHAIWEGDFDKYANACQDLLDAERRYENMLSEENNYCINSETKA